MVCENMKVLARTFEILKENFWGDNTFLRDKLQFVKNCHSLYLLATLMPFEIIVSIISERCEITQNFLDFNFCC